MTTKQDTWWEKFLQPVFGLMIDGEELKELSERVDWERECDRLKSPELIYPEYYLSQNFHGIEGGYLTSGAAVSYDPITQYALFPNETWNREAVIQAVQGSPRKIIDLGCGTGSTTLLFKQAFPNAEIVGLDLSPQMLVIAEYKASQAGLDIQWLHGLAEATDFTDGEFDLVTASLLFHETPTHIAQAILKEAFRLLSPAGQIIILDGNQKTLRHTTWLTEIFEEPYIEDYAAGSVDAWLGAAGFSQVSTEDFWWTNQLSTGVKSVNNQSSIFE
ncbi:MAG: class I SAM-dependent methyltransferase [Pleurocapsa sp. MO_226.B13]|nr:class I SAM-dependent methyltransferase [Pleurocapsa sp. MO_226.B13]